MAIKAATSVEAAEIIFPLYILPIPQPQRRPSTTDARLGDHIRYLNVCLVQENYWTIQLQCFYQLRKCMASRAFWGWNFLDGWKTSRFQTERFFDTDGEISLSHFWKNLFEWTPWFAWARCPLRNKPRPNRHILLDGSILMCFYFGLSSGQPPEDCAYYASAETEILIFSCWRKLCEGQMVKTFRASQFTKDLASTTKKLCKLCFVFSWWCTKLVRVQAKV